VPDNEPLPDVRLNPYRDRAGRLRDASGAAGVVYVRVQPIWRQSGHLWWHRWSEPQESIDLWMILPGGQFADFWLTPGQIDDALIGKWECGQLGTFNGVKLDVTWSAPRSHDASGSRTSSELGSSCHRHDRAPLAA
jgi:hypothetical protein